MLYALLDYKRIAAEPNKSAICCGCGGSVISKCGKINIWHWAHKSKETDCPSPGETEWHLNWKKRFPENKVEQRILIAGKLHIADLISKHGTIIELQHSPISVEDIESRERHYEVMTWVFDVSDAFEKERFIIYFKSFGVTFRWKQPRRTMAFCTQAIFLDTGKFVIDVQKFYSNETPFGGWGRKLSYDEFINMYTI